MTTTNIEQLRNAVTEIDSLSQAAFSEIAEFAKLALILLESPKTYQDPDVLARVLETIWSKADSAENRINCIAENFGANCKIESTSSRLRIEAVRKAHATALMNGGV